MANRTLAIIPARGGSKRVPRKNVRDVGGKPMIAHAIEDATESEHVDKTVVSTDDDEIARVAREYGGETPFERPPELATDTASLSGVVTHAIESATELYGEFDAVCVAQVTSPLRAPADIDGTIERLLQTDADSAISTSQFITPPHWAVVTDEEGFLEEYFESASLWTDSPARSQDIEALQHPNGAVYAATLDAWRQYESFYTPRTVGYEMPPERSFDVDEPWELEVVRRLVEQDP